MRFVAFSHLDSRYAIAAHLVEEVIPLVRITPLPGAPHYVSGMFNYRGTTIPAMDVSRVLSGNSSEALTSTRIIVVCLGDDRALNDQYRLLGLIAEQATQTIDINDATLSDPVVETPQAPFVGKNSSNGADLTLILDIHKLLGETVLDSLYPSSEA